MADEDDKYRRLDDDIPTKEEEAQEYIDILNNPEKFLEASTVAFHEGDLNGDGSIDRAEFRVFMDEFTNELGLPRVSDEALNEELAALDTDSNGTLDVEEYKVFVRRTLEKVIQITLAK